MYMYIQGQTVEGLRKSTRAAHILRHNLQPIRSAFSGRNRDRPQHRDHYPTLCEKCVGSFKSFNRRIERQDLRLTSLFLCQGIHGIQTNNINGHPVLYHGYKTEKCIASSEIVSLDI